MRQYGEKRGTLFDADYFPEIPTSDNQQFEREIRAFSRSLKTYVEEGIARRARRDYLKELRADIHLGSERTTYAIEAVVEKGFSDFDDPYGSHASNLDQAIGIIRNESATDAEVYTPEERESLTRAADTVESVMRSVKDRSDRAILDAKARGVIERSIRKYSASIEAHRTTEDGRRVAAQEARSMLVASILAAAQDTSRPREFPTLNPIGERFGFKSVPKGGFEFVSETKYHTETDPTGELLKGLFNSAYRNDNAISKIDTEMLIEDAVSGGARIPWRERWDKHVGDYIGCQEKLSNYIGVKPGSQLGGTLGEQSIAYYKFQASNAEKGKPILIDQPEDNVANSSIVSDLILTSADCGTSARWFS